MKRHDSHHEHDPEIIECRECGGRFDLALQYYYDNLCPSCKKEGTDWESPQGA